MGRGWTKADGESSRLAGWDYEMRAEFSGKMIWSALHYRGRGGAAQCRWVVGVQAVFESRSLHPLLWPIRRVYYEHSPTSNNPCPHKAIVL